MAPANLSRRAALSGALALPAIAVVPALASPIEKLAPAGFTPKLPDFSVELGERYLSWLHTEMIAVQHHLGITYGYVPVDRFSSGWRTEDYKDGHVGRLEARAVAYLWAAGVSVEPDPHSLRSRFGGETV